MKIEKYPRTLHVSGSRRQPGDEDLSDVPLAQLEGLPLVIEEKVDGANCGIGFAPGDGRLLLQSRGHFLSGGPREWQFALLKSWAMRHQAAFRDVLGTRYLMYGEWLYAKHTIFYDALPHYFLEFDVWDREQSCFLSTPRRRALLCTLPVVSVPVIAEGVIAGPLNALAGPSKFKTSDWRGRLARQCADLAYPLPRATAETDSSDRMEGLYIKWEDNGGVRGRYKFVRHSFLTTVLDSGSHWQDRPVIPNLLAPGVDLFA